MNALTFLFIAHFVVCCMAAYCFSERSTTLERFDRAIRASRSEPDGGGWFVTSQTATDFRLPTPVLIYASGGLLALFVALGIQLDRHLA
jgi:hypothetical protein